MEFSTEMGTNVNFVIFFSTILVGVILVLYVLVYSRKRKKISDLIQKENLLDEKDYTEENLKKKRKREEIHYISKKLLNDTEMEVYYNLIESLPFFNILTKVQYAGFIDVKDNGNRQTILNKLSKLSADFVLCKRDFSVVLVIELINPEEKDQIAEKIMEKKERVLKSANIPLVKWETNNLPSSEQIYDILKEHIKH